MCKNLFLVRTSMASNWRAAGSLIDSGVWHKKLLKSEDIDISCVKCFYKWNNF